MVESLPWAVYIQMLKKLPAVESEVSSLVTKSYHCFVLLIGSDHFISSHSVSLKICEGCSVSNI